MHSKLLDALRHPDTLPKKLKYHLLKPFGSGDYKKFIVLSRSRTGSNLLTSYLNSHPRIKMDGESFGWLQGRSYKEVMNEVFSKQPRFIQAKGCKVFYYHPHDAHSDEKKALWYELSSMKELRVIHLKRRNILRTVVSWKIAMQNDAWIKDTEKKGLKKRVTFDRDELEKEFLKTRNWEKEGDEMFRSHQLLEVTYEELAEKPKKVLEEVSDFLGVERFALSTHMQRQNPNRLSELIENFDELKMEFASTEWSEFFEE